MIRSIVRALSDCDHLHAHPSGWCPRCGAQLCADGEWLLPELARELVLDHQADAGDVLAASASARGAIEWIGEHPRGESDLEETIRALSGPTVALLVVNGIAQIFDGEGPRCRVTLSDRGVVELEHWRAVSALEHVCLCGHDRGDHGVRSPSPCGACTCVGFSVGTTAATEPPASADATEPGAELAIPYSDAGAGELVELAAWRQGGGR